MLWVGIMARPARNRWLGESTVMQRIGTSGTGRTSVIYRRGFLTGCRAAFGIQYVQLSLQPEDGIGGGESDSPLRAGLLTFQPGKSVKPGYPVPEGKDELFHVVCQALQDCRELCSSLRTHSSICVEETGEESLSLGDRCPQVGRRNALGWTLTLGHFEEAQLHQMAP